MLVMWPISAIPDDLIWRHLPSRRADPIDGGGNLISLAGSRPKDSNRTPPGPGG